MGPLSADVRIEAGVLQRTAGMKDLPGDQTDLLTTLRRRIATAKAAGVAACAGVSPVSALRPS
jgi:hypothetical protein